MVPKKGRTCRSTIFSPKRMSRNPLPLFKRSLQCILVLLLIFVFVEGVLMRLQ